MYRKETDQHHADDGEGFCEVCACTKASEYFDKKEQYELDLNKRLNYAGIEGHSLCHPISFRYGFKLHGTSIRKVESN